MELKIGTKVCYCPKYKQPEEYENGIVKSLHENPNKFFVVYNYANDWKNYNDYTAALTDKKDLVWGWDERARNFKN